jgi:hypothetical protein
LMIIGQKRKVEVCYTNVLSSQESIVLSIDFIGQKVHALVNSSLGMPVTMANIFFSQFIVGNDQSDNRYITLDLP